MRHNFLPKGHSYLIVGNSKNGRSHFYLKGMRSIKKITELIEHEDVHVEIDRATRNKTTTEQDHYIMKKMGIRVYF